MFSLTNYRLENALYTSAASVVCRARREGDGVRVIIKQLRDEYPSREAIESLKREHEVLRLLAIPEVANAIALERVGNGIALVLEDSGGEPLDAIVGRGDLGIVEFLRLAIAVARAVEAIHAKGVIHKDLKPQHMIRDARGAIKLIDFGISTELAQERSRVVDPDRLEGTLAYLPPEQTGRVNRVVDRRSDLYSLGVSFFELLTGQLPFRSTDPLELVHCHIAKTPPRADSLRPQTPAMVASILEKLMAKVAEDRYQTAAGLIVDLKRCLRDLEVSGAVAPFELGAEDLSDVLQIPQKLYGREAALGLLMAAFEQVRSGTTQLLFIAGPSGVGKSALVQQLRKELVLHGHFVSGKFDQLRGSTPYLAMGEACRELVRAILREPRGALAARKRALLAALGGNAGVVLEVVPELELIIGPQPPPARLGPAEAQLRFEQSFVDFLAPLATAKEPLVMFLDDLQWADSASLRLLRRIATAPGGQRLLVLGAYRDNEVSGLHPLQLELQELDQTAPGVARTLRLEPLHLEDVARLSADALVQGLRAIEPLAKVLFEKTQGNPFHLGQFLQTLCRDGLLRLDLARRQWTWELSAIEARRVTDNVVDLVLERLRSLPAEAQRVLSLGACIGHEFDSDTMALIAELEPEALARGLEASLRAGVLLPLDENYRYLVTSSSDARGTLNARLCFLHDRVQQAAYALIDESRRQLVHLRIGRHLREHLGASPTDEQRFAVAQQMNRGLAGMADVDERVWLAELNLACAKKAQSTAASAVALEHVARALELIGDEGWTRHPRIACAAHLANADAAYVSGESERALVSLSEVEAHATEVLDRVAAGNLRALVLTNLDRLPDACQTSVKTLGLLGVAVPEPADKAAIGQAIALELGACQAALDGREIASLTELPEMTDPLELATLVTLARAIPAAYQSNPELSVLLVLKGSLLSLSHGAADLTSFFFAQYAIAHLAITGDHATAFRIGKVGVDIGLHRANAAAVGRAHFIFGGFISHWCEPIAKSLEHFSLGLKRCLELGDVMHAAYCVGLGTLYGLHAGRSLAELRAELPGALQLVARLGDVLNGQTLLLVSRAIASLAGESTRAASLDGDGFTEEEFEAHAGPATLATVHMLEAVVRFHAGEYASVLVATAHPKPNVGMVTIVDFEFFAALAHAALARAGVEREEHLKALAELVGVFRRWAALCPENQGHRLALLEAEQADLEGDAGLALVRYEEAIAVAERQGFLHNHALACELSGAFHLRGGRTRAARPYLIDAIQAYESWGATGKATQLKLDHAALDLLGDSASAHAATTVRAKHRSSTVARSAAVTLDLESAMRATQAIASELESDKLLDRLMRLVIENAGARRGVLVLPRDGKLFIEAEGTVEPDEVRLRVCEPVATTSELPVQIIRFVARTQETVVSGNAVADTTFGDDVYIVSRAPKSVLCLPLMHQGQLSAVLYLENRPTPHVFSPARVSRIQFLAAHAAAALENSRLYEQVHAAKRELERRVHERTQELSVRNSDLRGVLDAVSQGLVTLDRAGRVVGAVSAKTVAWFGAIDEGQTWPEVLSRVDADFARAFADFFAQTGDRAELDPDGSARMPRRLALGERALSLELRPVGGAAAWSRMLVVISDITDEQRQRQLELELSHAKKLESVGRLAAGIAHEINTPAQFVGDSLSFLAESFQNLQGLLASYRQAVGTLGGQPGAADLAAKLAEAEAAADSTFVEENAPPAFERALDGISRVATLVTAMKEFAHPDRRERTSADLNRALRNTLAIARNEYKDVAEIETDFGELPMVSCHASDLNQVFLNLLVNAAHAVGEGVARTGKKGRIRVQTSHEGSSVYIAVEDTGCGIPEAIRDRIFDPFFTTKDVGQGTGQGLAIARSIVVDKHGGQLTFESTVGVGTTFTVVLPVGAGTAVPEERAA